MSGIRGPSQSMTQAWSWTARAMWRPAAESPTLLSCTASRPRTPGAAGSGSSQSSSPPVTPSLCPCSSISSGICGVVRCMQQPAMLQVRCQRLCLYLEFCTPVTPRECGAHAGCVRRRIAGACWAGLTSGGRNRAGVSSSIKQIKPYLAIVAAGAFLTPSRFSMTVEACQAHGRDVGNRSSDPVPELE